MRFVRPEFSRVWLLLSGLAFGVFPQAGVAALVPIGIVSVVKQPKMHDRTLEGILLAWGLVRAIWSWRVFGQPFTGVLEVMLMWLLYRGIAALRDQQHVLGIGTALGLTVSMGAAFVQTWSLVPFTLGWLDDPKVARLERTDQGLKYTPVQAGNAWVYMVSTIQGPGRIAFEFDLRAAHPITVGTFLNEYRLPGGSSQRLLESCRVSTEWKTCRLEVSLPNRAVLNLGVGGNFTWKAGDPALEFRIAHVRVTQPPTLLERMSASNRASGWSFNENGLGTWAALGALVVLVSVRDWRWATLGLMAGLLGVFLSGSRGALLALVIGLTVLGLSRIWRRWPWALPWGVGVLSLAFLVATFFVTLSDISLPSGLRAFDANQSGSVTSRLSVYRTALKIAAESPMIGVGNLQARIGERLAPPGTPMTGEVHAHNLVLQVLGESGIIGLVVMLALWVLGFTRLIRVRDAAGLALLTGVAVVSTVDYLFLYSPAQIAFWLALAGFASQTNFQAVSSIQVRDSQSG